MGCRLRFCDGITGRVRRAQVIEQIGARTGGTACRGLGQADRIAVSISPCQHHNVAHIHAGVCSCGTRGVGKQAVHIGVIEHTPGNGRALHSQGGAHRCVIARCRVNLIGRGAGTVWRGASAWVSRHAHRDCDRSDFANIERIPRSR